MAPVKRTLLLSILSLAVSALLLTACGSRSRTETTAKSFGGTTGTTATLPGQDRPQVTIGDKNFTEQFVLGELYKQALEAQGYSASTNRNIGPTEVTIQALQSGRLSMYPEYVGTWDTTVAGDQRSFQSASAAYKAGRVYALAHGLELLRPTPFSNTEALAVTTGYAQQNSLHTLGDLVGGASNLTLGGPPQFKTSPMGLPGLAQLYGVVPAAFKALEFGDQYQALDQGTVQAADVMSTDPQLLSGRYSLLGDPKRLFGWGNAVPVVTAKVLAEEGPAFATTINAVSALLSTNTMRQLNSAVDVDHQDPVAVAKQFLQAHGLVPAST